MHLYLDSADPDEITTARSWGSLDGVTTNPSLIARQGGDPVQTLRRVLAASPGPVLCQAVGWTEPGPLIAQARWLRGYSERIVIKLPMCRVGIQALMALKQEDPSIPLAMTMVCSVAQAYLCARNGADLIALFNGPLDQVQDQPVDLVRPVKAMLQQGGFASSILSCGRLPRSLADFAAAGSDICTVRFEFLPALYEHPYTDKRAGGFLADWRAAFADGLWPMR